VTKVASTAPAAVRDTGTPGAAVLNFDIPIGPAGPQGPAGPAGADMKVQVITAADYAALATPDPTTLYLISS
jgi:hypothetical protein